MTIVIPERRRLDRIFQKSRRETGSTPVVGSSRKMIRGVWMRAQARASFCRMPPESRSASRRRKGASRVNSRSSSRRARKSRTRWISAKNSMFSSMVRSP